MLRSGRELLPVAIRARTMAPAMGSPSHPSINLGNQDPPPSSSHPQTLSTHPRPPRPPDLASLMTQVQQCLQQCGITTPDIADVYGPTGCTAASSVVSSWHTALLNSWGLEFKGFGHWLQLMCCAYLLSRSKYFMWG